jgi:hypothetical protein
MSIQNRLMTFIKEPQPAAIVLRGGWGQGKTYFWHEFATAHVAEGKVFRPNYAYVSLFGLNSLAELRNALAVKIRPVDQIQDDTFMALWSKPTEGFWKRAGTIASNKGRSAAAIVSGLGVNFKHVSNVGPLYLSIAYTMVKKAVICLDDIERRGKGLDIKDVLGLIADLVNERNCSVVAILNDKTLDKSDQEIWDDNREKVFTGELRLPATCRQSIGYVYDLKNLNEDDRMAIQAIEQLDIKNVRLIQRIHAAIQQVLPQLSIEILRNTRLAIIRGLTLIVYCHAGQGSGAPPPSMLFDPQFTEDIFGQSKKSDDEKNEKNAEQKEWEEVLRRYRYYIGDKLDEFLNKAVLDGYPDMPRLQEAAHALDLENRKERQSQALTNAWKLFHYKVGDNSGEVIQAMYRAFMDGIEDLASHNADAPIHLVRRLGDEETADKMMNAWLDLRRGERWSELAPDTVFMFRALEDEVFKKAIEAAYQNGVQQSSPDFNTIMEKVQRGEAHAEATIKGLAYASVDDYVQYFKLNGMAVVKKLLEYPARQTKMHSVIHARVRDALGIIKSNSLIDRLRVEDLMSNFSAYENSMISSTEVDDNGKPVIKPQGVWTSRQD